MNCILFFISRSTVTSWSIHVVQFIKGFVKSRQCLQTKIICGQLFYQRQSQHRFQALSFSSSGWKTWDRACKKAETSVALNWLQNITCRWDGAKKKICTSSMNLKMKTKLSQRFKIWLMFCWQKRFTSIQNVVSSVLFFHIKYQSFSRSGFVYFIGHFMVG